MRVGDSPAVEGGGAASSERGAPAARSDRSDEPATRSAVALTAESTLTQRLDFLRQRWRCGRWCRRALADDAQVACQVVDDAASDRRTPCASRRSRSSSRVLTRLERVAAAPASSWRSRLQLLRLLLQHPDVGHHLLCSRLCAEAGAAPRAQHGDGERCHLHSLHHESSGGPTRSPSSDNLLRRDHEMRAAVLRPRGFVVARYRTEIPCRSSPCAADRAECRATRRYVLTATARRSPSARLYSAVPRSSQWPSMVTAQRRVLLQHRRRWPRATRCAGVVELGAVELEEHRLERRVAVQVVERRGCRSRRRAPARRHRQSARSTRLGRRRRPAAARRVGAAAAGGGSGRATGGCFLRARAARPATSISDARPANLRRDASSGSCIVRSVVTVQFDQSGV